MAFPSFVKQQWGCKQLEHFRVWLCSCGTDGLPSLSALQCGAASERGRPRVAIVVKEGPRACSSHEIQVIMWTPHFVILIWNSDFLYLSRDCFYIKRWLFHIKLWFWRQIIRWQDSFWYETNMEPLSRCLFNNFLLPAEFDPERIPPIDWNHAFWLTRHAFWFCGPIYLT